jgi:hypothetical protein
VSSAARTTCSWSILGLLARFEEAHLELPVHGNKIGLVTKLSPRCQRTPYDEVWLFDGARLQRKSGWWWMVVRTVINVAGGSHMCQAANVPVFDGRTTPTYPPITQYFNFQSQKGPNTLQREEHYSLDLLMNRRNSPRSSGPPVLTSQFSGFGLLLTMSSVHVPFQRLR